MLEHIFRNLNDIRVFDALDSSNPFAPESAMDIDEILYTLELPWREAIQIEDSLEHLCREKIAMRVIAKEEVYTGCEDCREFELFGIPRPSDHISHVARYTIEVEDIQYQLLDNIVVMYLRLAVFEHIYSGGII